MMRLTRGLRTAAAGAVVAAIVATTFVLTGPSGAVSGDAPAVAGRKGKGALDGLVFAARLGREGGGPGIDDTLMFADGLFVSTECERLCNYPAAPYFVRERDGAREFVSETRCPDKDATLVWRGTVSGDTVRGEYTWTVSRWYWTIRKTFPFEGHLTEQVASIGG